MLKDNNSIDIIKKDIKIAGSKVQLLFCEVLTDSYSIDRFILSNIFNLDKKSLKNLKDNIPNTNINEIQDNEISEYIYKGFLIIITKWKTYAIEVKSNLNRSIPTINGEVSVTGPKDSFIENFNTNIGLIRKRIPSSKLEIENKFIGRLTKTKVGILYIKGITNNNLVENVKKQLSKIDIDGLCDSSYLKRNLEIKGQLFPTVMLTERPDKSVMALLEGKIVIVVDNSPYALIVPSFLIDFFHTVDDYYQKSVHVSFIRIIRFFAFLIAILTPAVYIAVTTRDYDFVPLNLLLMLKAGRTFVPFPAYLEALFMIICFEILRESDIRMSTTSASAVSILGGLILGDAAVAAGIVSPIMIIVIAISSIAGLTFSSIEFVNVLRFYKVLLLLLSSFLGMLGVFSGILFLIYNLYQTKCFGYRYLIPFIPLDKHEIKDSLIQTDEDQLYRNNTITKNKYRGNIR